MSDTQTPVAPLWSDGRIADTVNSTVSIDISDADAERAIMLMQEVRDEYEAELTKLRAQLAATQAALTPN